MVKSGLYLLLVFLFCGNLIFAQKTYEIRGRIVTDSLDGFQVNIINISNKTGTISKSDGSFTVKAEIEHELLFSTLGYKPERLVVTDSIVNLTTLEIRLTKAVNMLEEVHISNIPFTGDLTRDVRQIKTINQTDFGLPHAPIPLSKAERRYHAATTSSMGIPLDPLIYLITGRLKMLKRQLEYEKEEKRIENALYLVSKEYIIRDLKIPEDKVYHFLYYCNDFEEFAVAVQTKKPLVILEYLEEKSVDYLKDLETE